MLRRLALLVVAHPKLLLAVTVSFLALAGVIGSGVSERLQVGGFDDVHSESARVQGILDTRFGGSPDLVLQVTARSGDVDDPAVATAVGQVVQRFASEPVTVIGSYWPTGASTESGTGSRELRSTDGRSGLILLHPNGGPDTAARVTSEIVDQLPADDPVIQVRAGGKLGVTNDIDNRVHRDLVVSESIAVPATLLLLIVVFGGVVAALLPLTVGLVSILSTTLVLFWLAHVTDVSVYALTVATAFGLGLAIDFGLLMVSRFREERHRGHEPGAAVVETVATAGRTIAFSAATVTVAMSGMLVFPTAFLRSVGIAAIVVVLLAALGAIVVLPALMSLLGARVDALGLPRRQDRLAQPSPLWRGIAAAVTRRPLRAALSVIVLLLLMGIPFTHAQLATSDERALPADSTARQVTTSIRESYPTDIADAVTVLSENDPQTLEPLARQISAMPGVVQVDGAFGRYADGALLAGPGAAAAGFTSETAGFMRVQLSAGAQTPTAQDLVRAIRALPGEHEVGGPTASLIDSRTAITGRLPLALAIMAAATLVLLFLFTGSIVVPIKALVLNLFMLSAVLGAMVWVFQDGHLSGVLGFTPAPLNIAMVVLLCCTAFSLSVDYEIFLLGRIKEAHDAGAATTEATIEGLSRVGRLVSSAAALLAVTLLSFATGLSFMKMFGIGTALAVLIDATLIRGVLVPAFMRIAGDLNWWAPKPLRRLHARIGLHESSTPRPPLPVTTGAGDRVAGVHQDAAP
ncbi:MMPL family transporter [Nocardia yamanashiensis]|uniref:MMPL family transporter n=1 Tax=Nocardia yamanashiensis TaxID=209247 RepID=UPI00082AC81A|nr:MMPL family transporter [Nocardia yamanashiensis]